MNHSTHVFPVLPTQLTYHAMVPHAGLSVLTGFLSAVDFRSRCEDRFSQFVPVAANHLLGKVLGFVALSLAVGGEQATHINQLQAAPDLLGSVASDATVCRFTSRIKDRPEACSHGFTFHEPQPAHQSLDGSRAKGPSQTGYACQPTDHRP